MLERILALPFLIILAGLGAILMIVPAFHAAVVRDLFEARTFLYSGLLFFFFIALINVAMVNYAPRSVIRSQLIALVGAFLVLPAMLAVPLYESARTITFIDAYFEMVSSLTTTGATVFDQPGFLAPTLHLWRGLVGWLGGLLIWIAAISILEPLRLGGFEVTSPSTRRSGVVFSQIVRIADPSQRLTRFALQLAPIYAGLTLVLWIALVLAGEGSLVALIHAMSTLSTSGISAVGGLGGGTSGVLGEALVFVFLVFALSRVTFSAQGKERRPRRFLQDPEIRIALIFILVIPAILFLRHWGGAFEADESQNWQAAFRALWGATFTVLGFLSTAGFESADWATARLWSGLGTPGIILVGLSLIGGGVATTAGGIKLLRVYALYRHGARELDKLIYPSSVSGGGRITKINRQGSYIAWVFFMLFLISIAVVMLLLSLTGVPFETALVFTIASLSTTGPLAGVATEFPLSYADISDTAKLVLAGAMVLGRLEALAIIALFNPEFWRS
jgi:trk system potassium uptake protein TrkH